MKASCRRVPLQAMRRRANGPDVPCVRAPRLPRLHPPPPLMHARGMRHVAVPSMWFSACAKSQASMRIIGDPT